MESLTLSNLITAICLLFIQFAFTSQKYTYETKYIDVPIDHFSFVNNGRFKLRYLINDTHWNTDGPIFFYTGNEGDIELFAQNTGFVWEIAAQFKARIVFAEHRFYGESLPFGNKSYSDLKYLGYLTSSQALADYIYLIRDLQKPHKLDENRHRNPVIAFGGSYGGMLAAWIRMKYPASVQGAIAASAPIWQFEAPCEIFNRIVTNVFDVSSSGDCVQVIRRSWSAVREVASSPNGKRWLSTNWKLCTPLQNNQDIENLVNWLANAYSNMAMTNYPYSTSFLVPLPPHPVRAFCSQIQTVPYKPGRLLDVLGRALSIYTNYTKDQKCVDTSDQFISNLGEQGWNFQACTEMIMPMCSNNNDMFENQAWDFGNYSDKCYISWKVRPRRQDYPIMEYGGKDLQAASNIVFSNGLLDPWSGGGVSYNISETVKAILIPEAAHHLDLRAANAADPASVIAARNFHINSIHSWLKSYYREALNVYYT